MEYFLEAIKEFKEFVNSLKGANETWKNVTETWLFVIRIGLECDGSMISDGGRKASQRLLIPP